MDSFSLFEQSSSPAYFASTYYNGAYLRFMQVLAHLLTATSGHLESSEDFSLAQSTIHPATSAAVSQIAERGFCLTKTKVG